jgi:transposase
MKIIEELESLENGVSPALLCIKSGLKTDDIVLFDFAAALARLNDLKAKYPHHRLLIGNKSECDWSEFALFGEREEDEREKKIRLNEGKRAQELAESTKQKRIESLKKKAAKLGLKIG